MRFPIAAIAVAGCTILGAGAALAQNAPQNGPYDQPPQGYYQQMPPQLMPAQQRAMHRHHGVMGIIRAEMRAGRLSQKEGTLIAQKIKQLREERHAQREARLNGEGAPPPQDMQQPR